MEGYTRLSHDVSRGEAYFLDQAVSSREESPNNSQAALPRADWEHSELEQPAVASDMERSLSSAPWRRLGPSSDSGDPSGSGKSCPCLCLQGAAYQTRQVGGKLTNLCTSAWESFSAWLEAEEPPSRYVALIPLSDARLKPPRTNLIVGTLMVFAIMLAVAVFFLVPRGLSAGQIAIHSDEVSWNQTLRTFQLSLKAEIPIFNPNYWTAAVSGTLHVLFYDAETGMEHITPTKVGARASPSNILVSINASHVPSNYTITIMEHCLGTLEPRTLVFFLKGHLTANALFQTQRLTEIDTYFMVDCVLINVEAP